MGHLSQPQLQALQQLLRERESDAQSGIQAEVGHQIEEPYAELAGSVTDAGDEATADVIIDVENARVGMQVAELRDLAAARERIAQQRYGICVGCLRDIGYARLHAWPTAERCADCQRLHEQTFVTPPHPML